MLFIALVSGTSTGILNPGPGIPQGRLVCFRCQSTLDGTREIRATDYTGFTSLGLVDHASVARFKVKMKTSNPLWGWGPVHLYILLRTCILFFVIHSGQEYLTNVMKFKVKVVDGGYEITRKLEPPWLVILGFCNFL